MTNEKGNLTLNLKKNHISNKSAEEVLDKEFNELFKTGFNVDVKRLFEIYEQLFYKIKKRNSPNKESHYALLNESIKYLNNFVDYCSPEEYTQEIDCDKELNVLADALRDINDQIFEKEISMDNANLVYPNGTFLRGEGQNIEGLPVWVMVQGEKREIKSQALFLTIKKLLGHPQDTPTDYLQKTLTFEQLNNINDGLPIENEIDIVDIDKTAGAEIDIDVELTDFFNYRESVFVCLCGAQMGGDPDEILPLEDIFKWGNTNNGEEDGNCHIIYYDLFSQQQNLILSPGQVSQPIKHRTVQGDIEGLITSVPSYYSDESTPIVDGDGNFHHPEGQMFDGVYIKGFTREIRLFYNGNPLTPDQGIDTITAGDLNGDGISGDQYDHVEILKETYGDNFAVFYFDAPLALSRTIKYATYGNDSITPFMNRGHAIPHLRMITDGEGGKYFPYPPPEFPGNEFYGTYGYSHQNGTIVDGEFSLSKIKERDPVLWNQVLSNPTHFYYNPDIFISKCLVNKGTGDEWKIVGSETQQSTLKQLNNGLISFTRSSERIYYYPNPRPPGYLGFLSPNSARSGGIYPITGQTSALNYEDDPNIGNVPIVFDVFQRYQDPSNNGWDWNANNGIVNILNIYGAPIFEYQGIYYTIGRLIRDKKGSEKQYMTFCPLALRDGAKNYSARQMLLSQAQGGYGPILFRYKHFGEGGSDWDDDGEAEIVANTKLMLSDVAAGGNGGANTQLDPDGMKVRVVFPGFCEEYWKHHLNGWGGKSTPYSAAGDTLYGGIKNTLDLYHSH